MTDRNATKYAFILDWRSSNPDCLTPGNVVASALMKGTLQKATRILRIGWLGFWAGFATFVVFIPVTIAARLDPSQRTAEYVVAMIVMLMGASLYAFLIGTVASLLSNLNAPRSRHRERIQAVTRYLHGRGIPHELNDRVRNYHEYLWARYQGTREDALLDDLPGPLRLDVMSHLARGILDSVPLFKYSSPALRDQLLMSLELQTYPPDCHVVREDSIGDEIYFVTQGTVEITSNGGTRTHGTLVAGDYFGYMSMALSEKRTGSIRTLGYCDMLVLGRAKFEAIREQFPEFQEVMKKMSAERSEKLSALLMDGIVI